ncbi:MAG: 1,4-dihydroxy-2-naphthoate octaprenyltransferase [Longimicrobiales bacterium]|nr:1,4-dihydroxy-2-naphthoate octaprenyltransferase [Longimicrobiales bacterium]
MSKPVKSVITCDLDGKIETFNEGAEELFGYTPDEAIGRLRVSAFSPGEVVLGHVGTWLGTAVEEGEFETDTVFVRKDGTRFAAHIRITPTFGNDPETGEREQIGYCGVTVPLEDRAAEQVAPDISIATKIFKWMVVTRAPFLSATAVGVITGGAAVFATTGSVPWGLFALAFLGTALLHMFANTANDYFDWRSGTDQANTEYIVPFTGGSRSIELGLVTPKGLLALSIGLLLASVAIAVLLMVLQPQAAGDIALLGLIGAFASFFYTAPPLRLAARKGLGELFVGLTFGPFLVLGVATVLRGELVWTDALYGLPTGILTAAILWINEFPDIEGDRATGKMNLVATLGWQTARGGYIALLAMALLAIIGLYAAGMAPIWAFAALLAAPLAIKAARILYSTRVPAALKPACAATIQLQFLAGTLFAVGVALSVL